MGTVFFIAGMALSAGEGESVSASTQMRRWIQIARGGRTKDRVEAIHQLGGATDKQLLAELDVPDVLADIATDEGDNPRVRKEAVDSLVQLTTDVNPALKLKTKDVLLKMLRDSSAHIRIRQQCADGLGKLLKKGAFEDRSAMDTIMTIAENAREQSQLRGTCIDAVADVGADNFLDRARKLLSDKDPVVRSHATQAIRKLVGGNAAGGTGMLMVLWTVVEDPGVKLSERIEMLRTIAAMASQGVRSKAAGPKIVALLKNGKDEQLLLVAVEVASMYAEAGAVQYIESFYKKLSGAQKTGPRAEVCYLLGDMMEQFGKRKDFRSVTLAATQVAALLVNALKNDDSPEVAKAASFALGQMYDRKFDRREVVKELIGTVDEDPEESVRQEAAESLSMITGRDFGLDAKKWLEWYRKNVKSLGPGAR